MNIEMMAPTPNGKDGQGAGFVVGVVRWTMVGSVADMAAEAVARGIQFLVFREREFFSDMDKGIALCREMRAVGLNALWAARIWDIPPRELLGEMRRAGCQRIELSLGSYDVMAALTRVREFGFEITFCNGDGASSASDMRAYSVAERAAVAEQFPDVHAVQFELAVAYYKARRFRDVMLPLGKAMTLGFPMNDLCLNLLACLSAARHYPDMASGLLDQARYGRSHPVVYRNRKLLRSWQESGGDVKGVRLFLDPGSSLSA